MSATLKIRLADLGDPSRAQLPSFAVAEIFPIPGTDSLVSQSARQRDFVLDLRKPSNNAHLTDIEPGKYSVRVKFASGEVLTQTVTVSENRTLAFRVEERTLHRSVSKTPPKNRRRLHSSLATEFVSHPESFDVGPSLRSASRRSGQGALVVKERDPVVYGPLNAIRRRQSITAAPAREKGWTRIPLVPGGNISSVTNELRSIRSATAVSGTPPVLSRVHTKVSWAEVSRLLNSHATPKAIVESMMGSPVAFQPTKIVHGRTRDTAKWARPLSNLPLEDEGRSSRYFALLDNSYRGLNSTTLACLPGFWTIQEKHEKSSKAWVTFEVPDSGREDPTLVPKVEVNDEKIADVLAFLESGDASAAYALIKPSLNYLFEKQRNPYAAAAGGYVLLYNAFEDTAVPWQQWILNLADRFTAIPDGMILYSTLLLQTSTGMQQNDRWADLYPSDPSERRRRALASVLEAVKRGPPIYRLGLSLLASNIKILSDVSHDESNKAQLESAASAVRYLRLRADPGQAFCVFNIPN